MKTEWFLKKLKFLLIKENNFLKFIFNNMITTFYKYLSSLALLTLISNHVFGQQNHGTGLIFDKEMYKIVEIISPALKFNNEIKDKYSLKNFCPTPGNQGNLGTCASWATGYAALTISNAIENNLSTPHKINQNIKSPLYIYNQIKLNNSCKGAYLENALKLAKFKGDCDLTDFNPKDCSSLPGAKEDDKAKNFKIKEYFKLFNESTNAESKIVSVINSLNSDKPVVIGISTKPSIHNVKKDGIYSPKISEEDGGGHALCIVGYDNAKKHFEVMNSWGTYWGNGGFFYLSYKDFIKYCFEAYVFTLSENNTKSKTLLKGKFQLLKFNGNSDSVNGNNFTIVTPYLSSDNYYYIDSKINKDDFFRIKATNLVKNSYVYILSFKPNKSAEILFPLHYTKKGDGNDDIPLITNANSTIELPENINNAYSPDQSGEDVLCILYSSERIEKLDSKILTMKNYDGNIWGWLEDNFKGSLISRDFYKYDAFEMGVVASEKSKGNIVPLILKVKVQ